MPMTHDDDQKETKPAAIDKRINICKDQNQVYEEMIS